MRHIRWAVLLALAVFLAGCAQQSSTKFKRYSGPEVTRIIVQKDKRRMYLMHHDKILRKYRIGLGFEPLGDKKVKGDGKTPEGHYYIDRRNPDSRFHLSLGISYPNTIDVAEAEALGQDPGGDIFIHGRPKRYRGTGRDWTWGCIAVTDRQMEEIYAMVQTGTIISIYE